MRLDCRFLISVDTELQSHAKISDNTVKQGVQMCCLKEHSDIFCGATECAKKCMDYVIIIPCQHFHFQLPTFKGATCAGWQHV